MEQLLTPQTLILLIGGAALLGTFLTVAAYLLKRSFGRNVKSGKPRPQKIRVEDEAAFTLATIKSVVTELKAEQKVLHEKLAVAERSAEENARKFELIAREIDRGVIIFNPQGYISFSNPIVRKMLAVDTWSRRRYAEIFSETPALTDLIRSVFENGPEVREMPVEVYISSGEKRKIKASVLSSRERSGGLESVTCIFSEVKPPRG